MKIQEQIEQYRPWNEQEERDKAVILAQFAQHVQQDLFVRENDIMHMSASAWIVNKSRDKVLMVYHNIYHSWSWTGGHADGERDLLAVALREAMEETGVTDIAPVKEDIFSLEILTVDGHEKHGSYVPSHLHLNVTYLLEADERETLRVKPDENSAVAWFAPEDALKACSEPWMAERIYRKLLEKSGMAAGLPALSPDKNERAAVAEPGGNGRAAVAEAGEPGGNGRAAVAETETAPEKARSVTEPVTATDAVAERVPGAKRQAETLTGQQKEEAGAAPESAGTKHRISDETIGYVGILAKLELNGAEKEQARHDMEAMLDYIDRLNELDTDGVEPMSHVFPVNNVFREDVVTNGDGSAETLANAPAKKDGGFLVPKTIG
jgi:aspartyl/glutamyl-tRNA(Asn/Gln) amidotransferase C subunit